MYIFAGANALLLSNAYFALILRAYFLSSDNFVVYIALIVGINVLALIKKNSLRDVAIFNMVVFLSALPLALQYTIIAANSELR